MAQAMNLLLLAVALLATPCRGAEATETSTDAVPIPTFKTGASILCLGHSFFVPMCEGMDSYARSPELASFYPNHTMTTIFAPGRQGSPSQHWCDEETREEVETILSTGTIDLFGMPIFMDTTIRQARRWIDLALSKNENTTFFIGVPYNANGPCIPNLVYRAMTDLSSDGTFVLVEELRRIYPTVPIFFVPYNTLAERVRCLLAQDDPLILEDIDSCCCDSRTSIYEDIFGHVGELVRDVAAAFLLQTLYGDMHMDTVVNTVLASDPYNYNSESVSGLLDYAAEKNVGRNTIPASSKRWFGVVALTRLTAAGISSTLDFFELFNVFT